MNKEKITVIVVIVLWVTYFTPTLVIFGDILNTTPPDISEGICLPSYEKQLRCGSTRRELQNFLLKVCSNTSVSLWKYTCVWRERRNVSFLVFCRLYSGVLPTNVFSFLPERVGCLPLWDWVNTFSQGCLDILWPAVFLTICSHFWLRFLYPLGSLLNVCFKHSPHN